MESHQKILKLLTRSYNLPIIIIILLLYNVAYCIYAYASIHQKREHLTRSAQQQINDLQIDLNGLMDFGREHILQMQHPIRAARGDTMKIYNILRTRVDEGYGIVRFGWSNAQKQLTAGSARGVHTPPYDLSDRDYIGFTSNHPHQFTFSRILPHIRTGGEILALAYGIYTDDNQYIGTLAAIYYLDGLRQMISTQLSGCNCDYSIYSPHGEVITQAAPHCPTQCA